MTYKEAKETIKSNYPPSHYSMLQEALDMAMEEFDKAEKYGWHDLRKNPNDVPNWDAKVLTFGKFGIYAVSKYGYLSMFGDEIHDFEVPFVIAWKEIESFEVKE